MGMIGAYMQKKYLVFIFLFLLFNLSMFSQINIFVKPSGVIFLPSSEIIKGYFDKESIFSYGVEVSAISDFYGLGAYVNYSGYTINISDVNELNGNWQEKSKIFSFGILKKFNAVYFDVTARAGMSVHSDHLALGDNKSRYGFRVGAEVTKEIYSRIGIFVGIEYDYNKLTVPEYNTFAYSRHNAYFSGKSLSTGGIFINGGLSLRVF